MRAKFNALLERVAYFYESLQATYLLVIAIALILLGCVACNTQKPDTLPATEPVATTAASQPAAVEEPAPAAATVTFPTVVTKDTKNPLANNAAAATAGQPLYLANCSFCHGATGASEAGYEPTPPQLNQGGVTKDPDGELFLVIKNGKGKMPAQKRLTDEQIWQVVSYVRTLAKP